MFTDCSVKLEQRPYRIEENCLEHRMPTFAPGQSRSRPDVKTGRESPAPLQNRPRTSKACDALLWCMLPVEHTDPINAKILAISEDKIEGCVRKPFDGIAERSGVEADVVIARIAAMLEARTIRRVRQTLLATNLADGALVAWKVAPEKIETAFEWMFQSDPFSGHVVLRSTDTITAGSDYKLWTTVKVPRGFSLEQHCLMLATKVSAERFRIMPAKGIFSLGVGHVRRKTIEPGGKASAAAKMAAVHTVDLSEPEWDVLIALKREFVPEEITSSPWASRAREAGIPLPEFCAIAEA